MASLPQERRRWGNYRLPHSTPQSAFAADRRMLRSDWHKVVMDWQKIADYLWGALEGKRNRVHPSTRALAEMSATIREVRKFAASARAKAWDEMKKVIEKTKQP